MENFQYLYLLEFSKYYILVNYTYIVSLLKSSSGSDLPIFFISSPPFDLTPLEHLSSDIFSPLYSTYIGDFIHNMMIVLSLNSCPELTSGFQTYLMTQNICSQEFSEAFESKFFLITPTVLIYLNELYQ